MKFTTAAIAATAASLVSAAPPQSHVEYAEIKDNDVFHIMSLRTGTEIQHGNLQAANNGLYLNAPNQNATCGAEHASFQLNNGTLNLYTKAPSQSIYVDRSGMGQGVIGYTTGAQPAPKNAQREGWAINKDSYLVWRDDNGTELNFQACAPALGGGYAVWLSGVPNPAGYKDCIPFTALALKEDDAVLCQYTQ
ncbi:cell wall [Pyrenophora seminiperda CCB06]|uniref:Cell wall n=1 Tax=Pyrenophora seminiperda CCB06 TaxID=1302712 RepID=A0A3M7M7T9_9PLEO|nr:cell wall [Pyrenophora seminiperda CCB06]